MRTTRLISAVDSHTEGMPTRVVTGGVGVLPGASMRWPVPDAVSADQPLQVRVNGAPQLESLAPKR